MKALIAEQLCSPTAQPTIPGGHPAPTGSSASSDENLKELIKALTNGALSKAPTTLSDPFKDSLDEARKHLPVPTQKGFKKIAAKISRDIAKLKGECIKPPPTFDHTCDDIYDRTGDIIDELYNLFTAVLPEQSPFFEDQYKIN